MNKVETKLVNDSWVSIKEHKPVDNRAIRFRMGTCEFFAYVASLPMAWLSNEKLQWQVNSKNV